MGHRFSFSQTLCRRFGSWRARGSLYRQKYEIHTGVGFWTGRTGGQKGTRVTKAPCRRRAYLRRTVREVYERVRGGYLVGLL